MSDLLADPLSEFIINPDPTELTISGSAPLSPLPNAGERGGLPPNVIYNSRGEPIAKDPGGATPQEIATRKASMEWIKQHRGQVWPGAPAEATTNALVSPPRVTTAADTGPGAPPIGTVIGQGDPAYTAQYTPIQNRLALPGVPGFAPNLTQLTGGRRVPNELAPQGQAAARAPADSAGSDRYSLSASYQGTTPPSVTVPDHISPYLNYWADYYGLDRNIFARMINRESSFDPGRKGDSGEVGLGQLMPGTAEEMGVKDRADINQNLMGSAQYLRKMLDDPRVQGDYRKALMLYNSGPNVKTPFQNTDYADAVLGTRGIQSGDVLGGGYKAGGATAKFVPQVPVESTTNGLGPGGGKPTPPPFEPDMSQVDQQSRIMQAIGLARAMSQGVKFTPINYDPFKVSRQPTESNYSARIGVGGESAGIGDRARPITTTVSGVPVREMNIPAASGTRPTRPKEE